MKNYKKIPFSRIKDIEAYAVRKLKKGHVIIVLLVNDDTKKLEEITSYAIDKECKSYFSTLVGSREALKNSVIIETIEPYYACEDEDLSECVNCCDIDIRYDTQNAVSLSYFKEEYLKGMKRYYQEETEPQVHNDIRHIEYYISTDKGDIGNFGGIMEIAFANEWAEEQGYL